MIGTRLKDRYEITTELGRGGMGVVYSARDPLLNRDVAVKLIPPTLLTHDTEERFRREAQLVAQMDHPGIVPIYDLGDHDGSLFFVMPVVQGTTLRTLLRAGSMPLGDIVDIAVQIAEALDYSHARGVVHRDIKPENIMISRDEAGAIRLRVMDFGLARASSENRLTKTGTIIGTLAYLSPEQVTAKEVDGRSDIYSYGTVLYECVVGEPPFSGEVQSILYRIVHEIPRTPRSLQAPIDEDLERVILACIAKEPAKRPQRASEIVETLRRYRSGLDENDRAKSIMLTRAIQSQRPALSPFVGRSAELAELQQRLNAAVDGECQLVVVGGEPGIGKTRLVDEIENLARARKIRVLHGRFVEQDLSLPYHGFREVIQESFRLRESSSSSSGAPDFSDLAADLVSLFPMLNEISEVRTAVSGHPTLHRSTEGLGPESRTQIFELLSRTLTRIAGGKPLVLILEDLHGAAVSLEALQYVVRRLGPTPILILGTYRTTEVDSRHPLSRMLASFRGDRHFSSVPLGPFSRSEHRLFLQTLVGGSELDERLVERLYDSSEGNPFFTKELVRSLLDSGGITRDDTGSWTLSGGAGISTDTLPATIQQAVEKRIERLPESLRDLLSIASVVGRSFDVRDLETLVENKTDLDDEVDRLIHEGLIEEERESRGDRLVFSSGVVRDVLYAVLSRRKRRSLHRKCAEQLEARYAGRLQRIYPQLVHHFSQGDVPEKTVEYGLQLARVSLDAYSPQEAIHSIKTAIEFLDEEWEGERTIEAEARLLLARALRMAGDVEGALKEAETAVRIFEGDSRQAGNVIALLFAAEVAWQARRTGEAAKWVERGLDAARSGGDNESLRSFLSLAATLATLAGDYEKAQSYQEETERLGAAAKGGDVEQSLTPGGKLVVALANTVSVSQPAGISTVEDEEILGNVFETLLATDRTGGLVPGLCEKWEVGDAGGSFVLTLRGGVRFQDGHLLTAQDVKDSFEHSIRRMTRELPPAFAAIRGVRKFRENEAPNVAGITVRSQHVLEIALVEPLSIYPALLTHLRTAIVRAFSGEGNADQQVLGTGPFRMASCVGDHIVLERNPGYWKGTQALLDVIDFQHGLQASAIAAGLGSDTIDVARDLLPEDLENLLRHPRFREGLVEAPKKNTYFVLFNSHRGPVSRNPMVRRALAGTVRAQDIVWRTLGRFAQPAYSLIPPGMLGHDPGRRHQPVSRERAIDLLHSAGHRDGILLKASVHPLMQDRYRSLLESLLSAWSEIGVEVSIETSSLAQYVASFEENEPLDLFIGRWNADYNDPDNFTHNLFHSTVGQLRNYFSSEEADRILEEARAESRPAVREISYRKFESLLAEAEALIPLFHDIEYRLASPNVKGLKLLGGPPYVNYAALSKTESQEPITETRRQSGGIVQVPIGGTVTHLEPWLVGTMEEAEVCGAIYETLTRQGAGAKIVPWLASEFRAEQGGRRYHFRLREDVIFHDGRRLSARDVRYSFEKLLQTKESGGRVLYSPIQGAKEMIRGNARDLSGFRIHSGTEFTIELDEPVSFFPALLAYDVASIVPEGSSAAGRSWQEGCLGTGPFRVVNFEPGRHLELERNKTYWRKGFPKSEGLTFSFDVSPKDIIAGFRAGRFSLCSDLFPPDAEALRREPEFASGYRDTPRLVTYFLAFNTHGGPLSDIRRRVRLVRSLDVPSLVRQTLGRLGVPAHGLIPPGLLGHESSAARSLAGAPSVEETAPGALEVKASFHPVFFGGYSAFAKELTRTARETGIDVRCVNQTITEYIEALERVSVDLVVGRWFADYPDADSFVDQLHTQRGFLGRLCGTPAIDRLIDRGRTETAPVARHSIYREIEEKIASECLILPLFHDQAYRFGRPELEGLTVSFWGQAVRYENLRLRG